VVDRLIIKGRRLYHEKPERKEAVKGNRNPRSTNNNDYQVIKNQEESKCKTSMKSKKRSVTSAGGSTTETWLPPTTEIFP
jgi:hypothetical protein